MSYHTPCADKALHVGFNVFEDNPRRLNTEMSAMGNNRGVPRAPDHFFREMGRPLANPEGPTQGPLAGPGWICLSYLSNQNEQNIASFPDQLWDVWGQTTKKIARIYDQ